MSPRDPLSPRKRPTQRRAQETVDAILGGAARVFGERGYAGGTTDTLVRDRVLWNCTRPSAVAKIV